MTTGLPRGGCMAFLLKLLGHTIHPYRSIAEIVGSASAKTEMSKSTMLRSTFFESRSRWTTMLSGFKSRCATEESCMYATPSKNCRASSSTSPTEASRSKKCNKGMRRGSTSSLPSTTSRSGIMRVCFVDRLACRRRSTPLRVDW
jgi:hypothetical protein